MGRIEENINLIKRMDKARLESRDNAAILSVLMDISESLAVIADCCLDDWQKRQYNEEVTNGK